jgi:hypothetical protein
MPAKLSLTTLYEILGQRVSQSHPFMLERFYGASGEAHRVQVRMIRRSQRSCEILIHIDCPRNKKVEVENSGAVVELLERLSALRFNAEFSYDVSFRLGSKAAQMLFPLKLPIMSGAIIDEFRGFRGVKREGSKIAYEVSLDSPELKELFINIEYRRREIFDSELLHQTIREAASIVEGIIPASNWSE